MDNAGDALGYFLPASGQLIFIKHFSYNNTAPEFCREYAVLNASSIAGIARSFDGGFLFGLNSTTADHIILIKTDSIGTLPTCGYQTLTINSTETILEPNTPIAAFTVNPTSIGINAPVTDIASAYAPSFDCREYFCPKDPLEDSCLSTYYKTFRSNSYVDVISQYHLLRGNKQFIATARYDRILGGMNQITYGLKILNEKGALLKAVSVYDNTSSLPIKAIPVDSQYVALVSNVSFNNQPRYNVTIVDEDLQQVWSKTFSPSGWYAGGMTIGDIHRDAEGNYYFISCNLGFMENPKRSFTK